MYIYNTVHNFLSLRSGINNWAYILYGHVKTLFYHQIIYSDNHTWLWNSPFYAPHTITSPQFLSLVNYVNEYVVYFFF